MESVIQKWGNSLAVRIPASYARELQLYEGSKIDIVVDSLSVRITPRVSRLEEFLAQVTPENLHAEIESGQPLGAEEW